MYINLSKVAPSTKISFVSGFYGKFSAACSKGINLMKLSSIGYLIECFSTKSGKTLAKALN
jgi:hypothetical protein